MMYLNKAEEIQAAFDDSRILIQAPCQHRIVISVYASHHSAAITLARVYESELAREQTRRVEVFDIPLVMNAADVARLTDTVLNLHESYPDAKLLLDNDGGGMGFALGYYLARRRIAYHTVKWDRPCELFENQQRYCTRRAQACVSLSRAFADQRVVLKGNAIKHQHIIEQQGRYLPFDFDGQGRYLCLTPEEMQRSGIQEPHIWHSLAFMFLEKIL